MVTSVTSMIYVGRCIAIVDPHTVVLDNAAWVAETGQYLTDFIKKGKTENMEIEIVGMKCVQWAEWQEWHCELFKERK